MITGHLFCRNPPIWVYLRIITDGALWAGMSEKGCPQHLSDVSLVMFTCAVSMVSAGFSMRIVRTLSPHTLEKTLTLKDLAQTQLEAVPILG